MLVNSKFAVTGTTRSCDLSYWTLFIYILKKKKKRDWETCWPRYPSVLQSIIYVGYFGHDSFPEKNDETKNVNAKNYETSLPELD